MPRSHNFTLWCQTVAGAKDPPLSVVRKFVHLLEQSPLDLQEEQQVTQLREEVVTSIRSNQQMEKDLNLMDIKIGLLVKNRISLQVCHYCFSPIELCINLQCHSDLTASPVCLFYGFFFFSERMSCPIIRR